MSTAPTTPTLAQAIRAKYPGSYDDMDDYSLEQKVLAKYPQYGDMPQTPKPQAQQPTASISSQQTGVLPWLRNLESDIRYGSNQTLPGRALHAIGMQPTSNGMNEAASNRVLPAVFGPLHMAQGAAQLPSHPWEGTKAMMGGALDTIGSIPAMPPEIEGLSGLSGRAGEAAGDAANAADEGYNAFKNYLAGKLRYPASARQSQLGRPGTVKSILPSFLQKYSIPEGIIPKGSVGSPTNPGPYVDIPMRVPPEKPPGLGDLVYRDATRMNTPYAGEEAAPDSIVYRDATRTNVPFAGEEAATPEEVAAQAKQNAMPRPLRPTVGTPEDFQVYDNQMSRLKQEASDAGTYSAARGKVAKKLNYQQRIGNNF